MFDNSVFEQVQEFFIPELTISTLQKYYPQIESLWEEGIQQATLDGIPYHRHYNILEFPQIETHIELVNLNAYTPEYEGSFYYLVTNYFYEDTYTSGVVSNDFLRWNRIRSKIRQEIVYVHKLLGNLIWQPPQIVNSIDGTVSYPVIPNGYKLPIIEVGKALGAVISSPFPIEVRTKNIKEEVGNLVSSDFILLNSPYLEITLKNIPSLFNFQITINFFGEYRWRSFSPGEEIEDDILIHSLSTKFEDRLKPPGQSHLPDNFSNSNKNPTSLINYTSRNFNPKWN